MRASGTSLNASAAISKERRRAGGVIEDLGGDQQLVSTGLLDEIARVGAYPMGSTD
jgi:hypothetical protein